ncbi:MAG: preprotein translocase subunit SecA [Mycoplasma sp.]|nr:preprotein translocase subunit SecA [Mycoplasma sp.]
MRLSQWNIFSPSRKILKKAKKLANYVDSLKDEFRKKSNVELSKMTDSFIDRLKRGQSLDDILPEAMATAREAIYRVHHIFAYKVQIIGAIVANHGDFCEMYTGEGKTIVIVLVAYLNALLKRGVHVVTVNEYLVQRDAHFCAKALNPLGITVGYNLANFSSNQKREMFACDITYTTNSELGFDYLRDNMVNRYEDKVIRELNFAIIDEGDSVLIDEARTPLIISGQPKQDISMYIDVDRFVNKLNEKDYVIDAESNTINLTDEGVKKAEMNYHLNNLFHFENSTLYHKIKNALLANKVFKNGVEYIVKDDKIFLIDQFTGRILEGRSYNAGVQQAIQAKENVKIEPENVTVATITYQSFFRLYNKLAGLSGTAATEAEEFLKIYNMLVVTIPTNRPVIRTDLNDYVFANKMSKWVHVVSEVERIHAAGQPILIGTESVEDSEELVYFLKNKGLPFQLLNAKNNAKEAKIIALAGQKGMITISTNMAGRGTDIKLGPGVKELGGLYVIGTAHHESRRIDNQLRGRSGRQGDPGLTRFFVSLDDTLFRRFAIEKEKKSSQKLDDEYYDSWFFTRLIRNAQKKVEAYNFDIRKNLIDYDSILSNQRELIYKQRDQILKNITNVQIAKNMAKNVAKDVAEIAKSPKNNLFVIPQRIADIINTKLFNYNLVSHDFFDHKTLSEASNILYNILCISIDKRIELLTPEVGNKIFKDIMIQALDYQWSNHLDLMVKVREGVNLRSYEQRSPLNIYVEEADKHFNEMKKNVAHLSIRQINHIFVPRVNEAIFNELSNILDTLNIDKKVYEKLKDRNNEQIIQNAFDKKPNFTLNLKPSSPKDKFIPSQQEKQTDAKETLSKIADLMKKQQENTDKSTKEEK